MTAKQGYFCNLCRESVGDGAGFGLIYRGDSVSFTVPSTAETHICQKCLDWIEAAIIESRDIAAKRAMTA